MANPASPASLQSSADGVVDDEPADVTDDVSTAQLADDASDGVLGEMDGADNAGVDDEGAAGEGTAGSDIVALKTAPKRRVKAPSGPRPLPPGRFDAYALRAARAHRTETGEGGDLFFPPFERVSRPPIMPPDGVAFAICSASQALIAVEIALLSMHRVYKKLASPVIVVTEVPIGETAMRRLRRVHRNIAFVAPPEGWTADFPAMSDAEEIGHLLGLWALSITEHERLVILQPDVLVLGDVRELWEGEGAIVGYDVNDSGFVPRNPATDDYLFGGNLVSLPAAMRGPDAVTAMAAIGADEAGRSELFDRFAVQRAWNLFVSGRVHTVLPLRCYVSSIYVLKCLDGSRRGVCLMHDKGEDPWRARVERKA